MRKIIFALVMALSIIPLSGIAHAADTTQSCSITTAPGSYAYATPYHYNYRVDIEWWIQLSSGAGCTPTVRVAGNVFFSNGVDPINGGFTGNPNLFQSGVLVTQNPPINVGSSGADGQFSFYGGWFNRQCGKMYKSGVNVKTVSAYGDTTPIFTSWTSAGSYTSPAC